MGKVDALLDVALEARNRGLEQLLLLVGDVAEDVDGLLGAVGLDCSVSMPVCEGTRGRELTPSSMGTEKKSTPTLALISSPPGTPGR